MTQREILRLALVGAKTEWERSRVVVEHAKEEEQNRWKIVEEIDQMYFDYEEPKEESK